MHKRRHGRGLFDNFKSGAKSALNLSQQFGLSDKLKNSSNPNLKMAGQLLGLAESKASGLGKRRHKKRGGYYGQQMPAMHYAYRP
jgi:hypothetical protein